MKSLLAKIGLPQALGLYVEDEKLHVSHVVAGPVGPVELAHHEVEAAPEELAEALEKLLPSLVGRKGATRVPVALGLPAERTYFSTRPIQLANSDPSPHVLLREALRSPHVTVDDMAADVIKGQPDKRPVASIVACKRVYLKPLLESVESCGLRIHRAEPGPCALLRAAVRIRRSRRSAKVVLRIFLSDDEAFAVLAVGGRPIVWRHAELPRGDEATTLISASRSLVTMSRHCGIQSELDQLIVHGRTDLARLVDVEWVEQQLEATVEWCSEPRLNGADTAFGLALGCLREHETAFDLATTLKPLASLREIFPWRMAGAQFAMLVLMACLLVFRYRGLEVTYQDIKAQNASQEWLAGLGRSDLETEKRDLNQQVGAIQRFLDGRVNWTSYGRNLAATLPDNVYLTSIEGDSELKSMKKKRGNTTPKKKLVLRGAVSIPTDGLVPHEIDRFLNTLRSNPLLREEFPVVELAALKQMQGESESMASFTIICLPKGAKKG